MDKEKLATEDWVSRRWSGVTYLKIDADNDFYLDFRGFGRSLYLRYVGGDEAVDIKLYDNPTKKQVKHAELLAERFVEFLEKIHL